MEIKFYLDSEMIMNKYNSFAPNRDDIISIHNDKEEVTRYRVLAREFIYPKYGSDYVIAYLEVV